MTEERVVYRITPPLTTERLYRLAERGRWPLYQPEGDYSPTYEAMTTLEADTYSGDITFKKKGKTWRSVECRPYDDEALLEEFEQMGVRLVLDPERTTLFN